MRLRRRTVAVLVAALLVPLTGTAGAADGADGARAERERARQEQAALAADLDVLEASEAELDAAAEALAADVRASEADVDAARQAVAAATAEVAAARAALARTQAEIEALTAQLVERAVDSFISPSGPTLTDVAGSADLTEALRKRAFMSQLVADDDALVDELRSAEEDAAAQRAAADVAEAQAAEREGVTEARLAELEAAAAEQARVDAALEQRQEEVVSEIEALAAAEDELTAVIEQAEREQREREERVRAEAAAAAEAAAQRERAAAQAAAAAEAEAVQRSAREQAAARSRVTSPPATGGTARPTTTEAPRREAAAPTATGDGGCIWPTSGRVTSEYGSRWGRLHAGIDISAPIGTPIYASKAGTVLVAGTQSGYGTTIVLDHGSMDTLYGHQSRLAVSRGDRVAQGELIGYVGNTGRSTGPHLHFETRYGGSPRNPRTCLP